MQPDRILFAPPVDGLPALGAESTEDFFQPDRLATWSRASVLNSRAGDQVVRLPLPGTRDESGRAYERPRGAGTGYVILRRYRKSLRGGLHARLSHPRSESFAEREWNLSCKLREAGVGTPDLMLAAARGTAFFARESVLVVRELEGMLPLNEWLASEILTDEERELGLESITQTFGRLNRSGIVLPELELGDIFVTKPKGSGGGCSGSTSERSAPGPLRRLPGVVLANLRGGFEVRSAGDRRGALVLEKLGRALDAAVSSSSASPRHKNSAVELDS